MFNFISTLVTLLPLAIAAPVGLSTRDSNPGCQAASFGNFAWQVENFDYHASYIFTTPAHQNSWGYVNFNLTNPALEYKAVCSATSNQLSDFFYGTMAYNCTVPDGSTTKTTFDFSRPSGALNVNQTWTCSDEDPQYPTTIHAYGAANLTLACTDETHINPNWTLGQIYSDREVKCTPVTIPLKPYQMTAVA
ncbi:uncharacterized protein GGS22DRAFT_157609 [Annulohypoxylon maeteangense]|uniref:uncharacterized protein n=1 Tax=Annulohypoxylon maeteangense TaxID=1927788 RepID=UPI002008B875|nr:uncharacterized protein GGS22DRAFT_157609 [Annulohypoxylon maeteangense]KAI0887614.1 hypothetical protein GGS22DRAFT_157609 [Annulohypoxylon maeteangense]